MTMYYDEDLEMYVIEDEVVDSIVKGNKDVEVDQEVEVPIEQEFNYNIDRPIDRD